MKVSLQADTLQKKLSFLNHAVSSRPQIPVLSHILLTAKNGTLVLSATDLEIGMQTTLLATIEEDGAVTLPAKTFSELIGSLGSVQVTVQTTGSSVSVTSKHTKSTFQTLPPDDFPKLFEEKGKLIADLTGTDLKRYFSSVIFAASQDSARPALAGVLVKREEKGFLLVSTDGYRLSLRHHSIEKLPQDASVADNTMIVPARVFREVLGQRVANEPMRMYVSRDSNQILFEQNDTILVGRLIAAEFPTYEKIIPSDFSATTTFSREDLLKAVKICSIFARDAANIIKLSLKTDKIIVSSPSASQGENTVDIEAKLTGEENDIAFNAKYLLDVLSNLEDETLSFEMTGPLNPGVFKISGDNSFLHLIMPIRVQG